MDADLKRVNSYQGEARRIPVYHSRSVLGAMDFDNTATKKDTSMLIEANPSSGGGYFDSEKRKSM